MLGLGLGRAWARSIPRVSSTKRTVVQLGLDLMLGLH
jgi:hypothetical protein